MCPDQIVKVVSHLKDVARQMPFVQSTELGATSYFNEVRMVIRLDADCVEYERNGSRSFAYMPKQGPLFDLRKVTNPLRRACRELQLNFTIETPNRYYKSRKATVNEFLGYESPDVILDIVG